MTSSLKMKNNENKFILAGGFGKYILWETLKTAYLKLQAYRIV